MDAVQRKAEQHFSFWVILHKIQADILEENKEKRVANDGSFDYNVC